MKRRTRTQPANPFYSNEPAVARGMIADKAPVQNASLGNQPPKAVPKHPGKASGIAGFVDKKKPKPHKPVPISGKVPINKARPIVNGPTKLKSPKLSGHPGAHRIGQVKKIKGI